MSTGELPGRNQQTDGEAGRSKTINHNSVRKDSHVLHLPAGPR